MPPTVQDINDLLQQYFDKVLVLTVPRFKERQEKVAERLSGISFEFFYGVDKNDLDVDFVSHNYVYDKRASLSVRQQFKEMNMGEMACALSHRKIYQAIADNNWKRVLILEDDVIPDFNTLPLLFEQTKDLPPDWELFYLGYLKNEKITTGLLIKQAWYKILRFLGLSNLSYKQISHIAPKPFSATLMKAGFHDCTHAYAVSNAGAKKLLLAQTPVKHRADNLLSALVLDNAMEAYASKEFLFNQEIFNNQADESHVREPQKLSVS
jgi:glycosyl transferase family 25